MELFNSLMNSHLPVINIRRLVLRTHVADFSFDLADLNLFTEALPGETSQEVVIPLNSLLSLLWNESSPTVLLTPKAETSDLPDPTSFASSNLEFGSDPFFSHLGTLPELNDLPPQEEISPFLSQAKQFIASNTLILSPEGVGGTYFVQDSSSSKYAVFKPVDEEPGAPNNPKKLVTDPLLPPGGGAIREVAAYLLDHGSSGVPPTFLVENVPTKEIGRKTGSVQQFMLNDGNSSEFGCSSFAVEDVHRIGILDIRLLNLDRNGENILIRKEGNQHRLIPIDHSYILPEKLDGAFFEWMYWPQAKKPFSEATLDYIRSIDIESDARILRNLGFSELSVQTMVICSVVLKHCATVGKTLNEIATIVCRDISGDPSQLEVLVSRATELVGRENTQVFCDTFTSLLTQTL